jgi:hypothetical protein
MKTYTRPSRNIDRHLKVHSPLKIHKLTQRDEIKRFDQLLVEHHYLSSTPPVGDFLRQVVSRDDQWVGLLVWGPSALKFKDRDQWIGWNRAIGAKRQKLVVQNRRFLVLVDRGKEPNLASQILGLTSRVLAQHWQESFGYRPLLAESFTDPEFYKGTCYKAAGWEPIGMSKGNSRHYADHYVPNERPKKLWIKELCANARKKACAARLDEHYAAAEVPLPSGIMPIDLPTQRSLFEVMRQVPDPRASNTRFRIGAVLSIVVMAILTGARQISEIARFAQRLTPKQRRHLALPIKKDSKRFYQVPNYAVFYQVLTRLDPELLAYHISSWLSIQQGILPGVLALDGKMIRDVIGMVSLVETEDGSPVAITVMDQKEGTKRCELKAAQELINACDTLENKTVTADALHCQKKTAQAIIEKGGHYCLQIKDNQPALLEQAKIATTGSPFLSNQNMVMAESINEASK